MDNNITRKRRRAEGLCLMCGGTKEPERRDKIYCKTCAEQLNKKAKDRKRDRQKNGLCMYCGKPLNTGEYGSCKVCTDKNREASANYRELRRQKGLCIKCGGPIEADRKDKHICGACLKSLRKNYRTGKEQSGQTKAS